MNNNLLQLVKAEVEAGRVSEQTHPCFPELSIFKYTDVCTFENAWNAVNRICRGLILNNQTGEIIARSFPKFFNLGETPESSLENLPNESFEVFEKMDGSMGSLYVNPSGEWAVATPGSMMSEQSLVATVMLSKYNLTSIPKDVTPVVEIIYPENRVVVDYGPLTMLVLLAVFNRDGTEWSRNEVKALAEQCGFELVRQYESISPEGLTFRDNQEGYVIRFASGLRLKVKSPVYVAAHRFLTNVTISRTIEGVRNGTIAQIAAQCPQTIKDRLDDLIGMVNGRFSIIKNKIEAYFIALKATVDKVDDAKLYRKNCAIWIQGNVPRSYQAGLFLSLSGQDLTEFLWKITEQELIDDSKTTSNDSTSNSGSSIVVQDVQST